MCWYKFPFRWIIYIQLFYIAIIANRITPGIPNNPTNIDVITFIPICSPHAAPIKFIMYNSIIPITEFNKSLIINFIGTINNLPMIIIPIKHTIYIDNIFISNFTTSYNIYILLVGQIYVFYIASYFILSTKFTIIFLSFAFFIK